MGTTETKSFIKIIVLQTCLWECKKHQELNEVIDYLKSMQRIEYGVSILLKISIEITMLSSIVYFLKSSYFIPLNTIRYLGLKDWFITLLVG